MLRKRHIDTNESNFTEMLFHIGSLGKVIEGWRGSQGHQTRVTKSFPFYLDLFRKYAIISPLQYVRVSYPQKGKKTSLVPSLLTKPGMAYALIYSINPHQIMNEVQ